jgi:hypothetical protein
VVSPNPETRLSTLYVDTRGIGTEVSRYVIHALNPVSEGTHRFSKKPRDRYSSRRFKFDKLRSVGRVGESLRPAWGRRLHAFHEA